MDRSTTPSRLHGALSAALLSVMVGCGRDQPASTGPELATSSLQKVAAAQPAVASGTLRLVTTTTTGAAATIGSTTCGLSADGNLVLFASTAPNLVAGDNNGTNDLFLRNLTTGLTTRVTTGTVGVPIAGFPNCAGTTMTPDGRLVAFNLANMVFVKNTQTGQLQQVSPAAGTVPQVTGFFGGVLSDDGTKVVFSTTPQQVYLGAYTWENVIPARLMLRDLTTGSVVTLPTDNVAQGEVLTSRFAISPDGTRVAFVSSSANLVNGDTNGRPDVFVRNLTDGTTVLASSTSAGVPAVGVSQYWSPNFVSNTQLAFGTGGPSNLGESGLYLKDLVSGLMTLVLRDVDGGNTAVLSGDARLVAFSRNYSGFSARIFLRDRLTGIETVVSASASGAASDGSSTGAVISRSGTHVAFGSSASNLVSPRPPQGVFQIYAKAIAR
ncbi:TolB family protein [Gemmatimonas groenlandica]|uniref:Lipoprotein n=1 Tax=Gemmatimonas groenlandica TaxID=2732249 RepID=A0A6M4IUN8_9BACT|nr:PD40 domain-containing protein [Gemmatimonas groenlandica]QJR37905.1 hypothetical protein HKW67_21430 [Gemmatimonas groenlandica]